MLTIGSRGSQLALWQARWIQARLEQGLEKRRWRSSRPPATRSPTWHCLRLVSQVGTKGLFTKEIEEALLNKTIDLAVHSLKDMPTELPEGLTLAAIPEREDPRDALIGRQLAALAQCAHVGTSSLRRAAQLRAFRPDLEIENIRGNLDTRLRKLDEGQLRRHRAGVRGIAALGLGDRITEL